MSNAICHVCLVNLSYREYTGTKLLDTNGDKPCFECLLEAKAFDDEEEEADEFG